MKYPILKSSQEQVNNAGVLLAKAEKPTIEYYVALEVVSAYVSSHAYPLTAIRISLDTYAHKVCKKPEVVQRLKRTQSIVKKLNNPKLKKMTLWRIQDIGGCRAVVDNMTQLRLLYPKFVNRRSSCKLSKKPNNYVDNPKSDGYRSIHLVYSFQSNRHKHHAGRKIEVQLRTKLQHAWATAVEIVGRFVHADLKAGEGPNMWKDFFRYASAAFALEEGTGPVPAIEPEERSIRANLKRIEENLSALTKIENYTIGIKYIEVSGRQLASARHFVLSLNLEKKALVIYPFQDVQSAMRGYYQIEKERGTDGSIDNVSVSANSLEEIKSSYKNYFIDTDLFRKTVRDFIIRGKTVRN